MTAPSSVLSILSPKVKNISSLTCEEAILVPLCKVTDQLTLELFKPLNLISVLFLGL